MPADFLKCIKDGGKVTTKDIDDTHYMHICVLNGKSYGGEVHHKQTPIEKVKEGLKEAEKK